MPKVLTLAMFKNLRKSLSYLYTTRLTIFYLNQCHVEYFLSTTLFPNFLTVNLQLSSYLSVFTSKVENIVDHDQMASKEAI